MKYLSVKNWHTHQHYSKRNPPWIKLHRRLLDDPEFCCLPMVARAQLMSLWLLAAKYDNKIPDNPEFISHEIRADGPLELEKLISDGWIERCSQDDSKSIASCEQSSSDIQRNREAEIQRAEKPPPSYSPPLSPDQLANTVIREAKAQIGLDVAVFKAEEWAAAFLELGDLEAARGGVKEFFACVKARAPSGPTGYITAVLKGGAKQYLEEQKNAKKSRNGHSGPGSERIRKINAANEGYVPRQ